jgi:hypothetical protein
MVAFAASLVLVSSLIAQASEPTLPHLVRRDGRHALIVDGAPFLILGGQCHNSSAWPSTLPKVWSAIEALHANTLEAPISWEQFEPDQGRFDYAIVDELLASARERKVRLVLLWFGTWKNGSSHYLPLWMKRQPELCPRIVGKDGRRVDSPSPHAPALLEADTRAFRALMRHLKTARPAAHGDHGAGRERARRLEHDPRLLSGCPEALHGARPGGASKRWARTAAPGATGRLSSARTRTSLPRLVGGALRRPGGCRRQGGVPAAALRQRRPPRPASQPPAGTYESGGPTDGARRLEGGRAGG